MSDDLRKQIRDLQAAIARLESRLEQANARAKTLDYKVQGIDSSTPSKADVGARIGSIQEQFYALADRLEIPRYFFTIEGGNL
mgnify:CR=1 FL=1